ncbi:MAG: flagellar hook-associated protein FlgL [Planctomycetota bacterium]
MAGWGRIYNDAIYSLRKRMDDMARLQEMVATGSRVIRPSDDPGDAFRVLTLQNQETEFTTYRDNIHTVESNLNYADTNLQAITDQLAEAKALVSQAASATYSQDDRMAGGYAMDEMIKGLMSNVNANSMGRYIFAGDRINRPPYEATRNSKGSITNVKYAGSLQEMRVPVGPNIDSPATLVGDDMFREKSRQNPVFSGSTGAAEGNGTASARGNFPLLVSHTSTTVTATNGVAAGAGSAGGDTILGDHTVEMNAGTNSVRLDGGDWVELGTISDLSDARIENERGAVAYVDLTAWDGTTSSATFTGNGTMSIDDGTTTTPIDFTETSQAVVDADGQTLFVDATGIQQTGTELVRIGGTYDLFGTLIEIRDLMFNKAGYDHDMQGELLSQALYDLEDVMNGVTEKMTAVGGRIQALTGLDEAIEGLEFSAKEQKAAVQDADVTQVATDLAKSQTFYEMTLASSSKLLNMSLLDYL